MGDNDYKIDALSTGPLARPLAHSLAPLKHSLVPNCSLRSRAHSFASSLPSSWERVFFCVDFMSFRPTVERLRRSGLHGGRRQWNKIALRLEAECARKGERMFDARKGGRMFDAERKSTKWSAILPVSLFSRGMNHNHRIWISTFYSFFVFIFSRIQFIVWGVRHYAIKHVPFLVILLLTIHLLPSSFMTWNANQKKSFVFWVKKNHKKYKHEK